MNSVSDYSVHWDHFRHSLAADRLAHAYLVVGEPRGVAGRFAFDALMELFGAEGEDSPVGRRLAQRVHPDVVWLEPQSRSRSITVDDVRDEMISRMQQTAQEGEWKAGVILYADRMTEQAANAFLKTLEEPAGRTLLLLLTDRPENLLPTISSRCQQIVLSRGTAGLPADRREPVLAVLRGMSLRTPLDVFMVSDHLRALLDAFKKEQEAGLERGEDEEKDVYEARLKSAWLELRAQVMQVLIQWQRDVLYCVLGTAEPRLFHFPAELPALQAQAEGLPVAQALQQVQAVEDMARRIERHVPPLITFDAGFSGRVLGRPKKRPAATRP